MAVLIQSIESIDIHRQKRNKQKRLRKTFVHEFLR